MNRIVGCIQLPPIFQRRRASSSSVFPLLSFSTTTTTSSQQSNASASTPRTTGRKPKWRDLNAQRTLFDSIAQQLNIRAPEDWYHVSINKVRQHNGRAYSVITNYYNSSLCSALRAIYPEIDWQPWRFDSVPRNFWSQIENQRKFFDWAAEQLFGIERARQVSPDDWYTITADHIWKLGGGTLLTLYYSNSLLAALRAVYPEFDWDKHKWRFASPPKNLWRNLVDQRKFFDWAATQLGVRNVPEDWYRVGMDDIRKLGGETLVYKYYRGSLIAALQSVYPDVEWHPWRFTNCRIPRSGAEEANEADVRRYLQYLTKELDIQHLDDWYRVSAEQIRGCNRGGSSDIISRNGGLCTVLKRLYPQHGWDEERFNTTRGKRAAQRSLKIEAQKLFPNEEILEDHLHETLRFSDSGDPMQFDVFIPRLSLALEYQGQQHYSDVYFFGAQNNYRARDEEKAAACKAAGITLVTVPFWFMNNSNNGSRTNNNNNNIGKTLAAAIKAARPDITLIESTTTTTTTTETTSPPPPQQ